MMAVLLAWVAFPVVLSVLALGFGRLVEFASGTSLPGALVLPAGLAAIVVVSLFPAVLGAAWLTTPLIVILGVCGVACSLKANRPTRAGAWAAVAAVATFAVFGAPVLLSGKATFVGYIKLDDTATYLAMLDRFTAHGYNTTGLQPSTYEATVKTSLAFGYPMGSLMPLGIGRDLVRQDPAWLWQPYLSYLAAMLSLGLYAVVAPLVSSRPARALTAFVASQSALLYGYAMWGGIKELATAEMLVLLAACVPLLLKVRGNVRAVVPAAVAAAAIVGVLSVAGSVWLAPVAVTFAVVAIRGGGLRRTVRVLGSAAVAAVLLAIPSLVAAASWLGHAGGFASASELGNLPRPLRAVQIFGVWPVGDFRDVPERLTVTYLLIGLVAVLAVLGLMLALSRRAWGPIALIAAALLGAGFFVGFGSPWIGGKGLATASPMLLALALVPLGALLSRRGRVGLRGAVVGAASIAVVVGVIWSTVLAYHDVWLAPYDRLHELQAIGRRYAGSGPTLMTEFESYGVRHFLRRMDPESASELRRRVDALRTGQELEKGASADIDEFQLADVLAYRTLVLRRSPSASRPPSVYSLIREGRYYDVWQRPESAAPIREHLSLGDRFHAAAVPDCSAIRRLARLAAPGDRLVGALRLGNAALEVPASIGLPSSGAYGEDPAARYLTGATEWVNGITIGNQAVYDVGIEGSFLGRLDVYLDGRRIATARDRLNWPSEYEPLGSLLLAPGDHTVRLVYHGPDARPGSGSTPPFGVGPLVVGVGPSSSLLESVAPSRATRLCGQSLDWVELRS